MKSAADKQPSLFKPAFVIKAVAFPGEVLHDSHYLDSPDFGLPRFLYAALSEFGQWHSPGYDGMA